MAATGGARAEVHVIGMDRCSGGCDSNAMDDTTNALNRVDVTMSPVDGGGTRGAAPNHDALLFDPEAVPAVLASGLPSALPPNGSQTPDPHTASTYVDFEYVLKNPNHIGGPAEITPASFFMSIPSLVGRPTLGDILSSANAYFADFHPPPRPAIPFASDSDVVASHPPSNNASRSTGDGETKKGSGGYPMIPWISSSPDSPQ
jgi:hypothetical protein